jgi:hypothetical protein
MACPHMSAAVTGYSDVTVNLLNLIILCLPLVADELKFNMHN